MTRTRGQGDALGLEECQRVPKSKPATQTPGVGCQSQATNLQRRRQKPGTRQRRGQNSAVSNVYD